MNAEELEELLSPIRKEGSLGQVPAITIDPTRSHYASSNYSSLQISSLSNQITTSSIPRQTTGYYFNSSTRIPSSITRVSDLRSEDRESILNAAIDYVRNTHSQNRRFERDAIHTLKLELRSFVETYLYRWYTGLINPTVECVCSLNPVDLNYTFSFNVNDHYVGTIGVNI